MVDVVDDGGVQGVERPGGRVLQVAALGDGEADDAHGGVEEPGVHGVGVVGSVEVLEGRPDDARLERPVGVADDERVQDVLRLHGVPHHRVVRHHPHTADAPVLAAADLHQGVDVHRLV